jgi:hypothetical protein
MPRRYNAIKRSIGERSPELKLNEVKTAAAKIYESTRKPHEAHLSTVRARERKRRVR